MIDCPRLVSDMVNLLLVSGAGFFRALERVGALLLRGITDIQHAPRLNSSETVSHPIIIFRNVRSVLCRNAMSFQFA